MPGRQDLEGNFRAHELSRATLTPRTSTLWPEPYDPREQRRQMHKERTALMLELRQGATTLRSPSLHFSRLDASLIGRAQTETLLIPLYTHHIQGLSGQPTCPDCSGYPSNAHTLWDCPAAQPSLHRILASLPSRDRPKSWSDWTAPSEAVELRLWPLLIRHVHDL